MLKQPNNPSKYLEIGKKMTKPKLKFDVHCAWGFAYDVLLNIGDESYDLTKEEALALAGELAIAATQAANLEREANIYFGMQEKQENENEKAKV